MEDKLPAAITILVGTGIVAVIAGFNNELGKFLFAFMVIVALVWFVGGGTQTQLAKWTNTMSGNTGKGTVLV